MATFHGDIILKLDNFEARSETQAHEYIDLFIDRLAEVGGLTWCEVDWSLKNEGEVF